MISLFIDTSLSDVSIALLKNNKILSLIHNNIPEEHSIYVTKYIEEILNKNKIKAKDVNEIIVINGPGSFTGIRIGITIAKVFAYLKNIRIVSLSSLQARIIGRKAKYILSTIDAKHNNYYVGLYNEDYSKIKEAFMSKEDTEKLIEEYNPLVVTEKEELNVEDIIAFSKKLDSINPHFVNPYYLKLPEAMEKK